MPVSIGSHIPEPEEPTADIVPDVKTDIPLDFVPLISMEVPFGFPANFDQLSKEEQDKIKAQYQYGGIRLRSDIKDRTIPLTKETLDIP